MAGAAGEYSTFWQNNIHNPEAFHFYHQDIQNRFYIGLTDDVNMEFSGKATVKLSRANIVDIISAAARALDVPFACRSGC